jgi:hypothetical protein
MKPKGLTISDKGRAALDDPNLDPAWRLILEVMSRTNGKAATWDNIMDVCDQAVQRWGSIEAAIEAFETGEADVHSVGSLQ